MPFKTDEERKAAFARMKGKGSGGAPKPPGGGDSAPPIFDTLGHIVNPPFVPKPPGPGIPGLPAGSWVGTGGAIYGTPASNWFQAKPPAPDYGSYAGPGVGPYVPPVFEEFEPAETIWGSLYLITQGIDPNTGEVLPPYGTPGTLKPIAGTWFADPIYEQQAAGRITGRPTVFGYTQGTSGYGTGGGPANLFPTIPSGYTTRAPNRTAPRPWWAK